MTPKLKPIRTEDPRVDKLTELVKRHMSELDERITATERAIVFTLSTVADLNTRLGEVTEFFNELIEDDEAAPDDEWHDETYHDQTGDVSVLDDLPSVDYDEDTGETTFVAEDDEVEPEDDRGDPSIFTPEPPFEGPRRGASYIEEALGAWEDEGGAPAPEPPQVAAEQRVDDLIGDLLASRLTTPRPSKAEQLEAQRREQLEAFEDANADAPAGGQAMPTDPLEAANTLMGVPETGNLVDPGRGIPDANNPDEGPTIDARFETPPDLGEL